MRELPMQPATAHFRAKSAWTALLAIVASMSTALANSEDWTPVEYPNGRGVDTQTYYRTVTTVRKVVTQTGVLTPTYAIILDVDSTTGCESNRIVAIKPDGDITWQLLDSARLALVTGARVAVVVDRAETILATSGCERPTVVRLAVLAS